MAPRTRFGHRATFAVEVAGPPPLIEESGGTRASDLREVDVWAAGKRLTCHDNVAFVPTLIHHIRHAADLVRRREVPPCPFPWRSPAEVFRILAADDNGLREKFWLLNHWDEILDGVETYTWLDDRLTIAARIWRPARTEVFVARVPPAEFVTTVEEATGFLHGAPG